MAGRLKLGLIGDHIASSRAPALHRAAGVMAGLDVGYDRLVPADRAMDFDTLFDWCMDQGYRGINVTYPYKERAFDQVSCPDPAVHALGAVNTVLFARDGPQGFNTDHSGFISAYRALRPETPPGTVCVAGAGGVGKAVVFGLLSLGAGDVRLFDPDVARADALADAVNAVAARELVRVAADASAGAFGADGLINCSPLGMDDDPRSPFVETDFAGSAWAFDAVYTPPVTPFLASAVAHGLTVIPGFELFFHQGVDAWRLFSGKDVDQARLRADLTAAT